MARPPPLSLSIQHIFAHLLTWAPSATSTLRKEEPRFSGRNSAGWNDNHLEGSMIPRGGLCHQYPIGCRRRQIIYSEDDIYQAARWFGKIMAWFFARPIDLTIESDYGAHWLKDRKMDTLEFSIFICVEIRLYTLWRMEDTDTKGLYREFDDNHDTGKTVGVKRSKTDFMTIEEYLPHRIPNAGHRVCSHFTRWAMDIYLMKEEILAMHEFEWMLGGVLALTNDYFSWRKEKFHSTDHGRNTVPLLMQQYSLPEESGPSEATFEGHNHRRGRQSEEAAHEVREPSRFVDRLEEVHRGTGDTRWSMVQAGCRVWLIPVSGMNDKAPGRLINPPAGDDEGQQCKALMR
ncbi:hypothetical protein BDZ97DRAFT_1764514 [Flammula alnicola]|nr:hypothetical protein BDZ97DRAFT_1764514 [Flammula alnicola]